MKSGSHRRPILEHDFQFAALEIGLQDGLRAVEAQKYGVDVARLCIRYCLQLGLLPLPKTTRSEHMRSNADLDFVIADEDMADLKNDAAELDYGEASAFPVFGKKRPPDSAAREG